MRFGRQAYYQGPSPLRERASWKKDWRPDDSTSGFKLKRNQLQQGLTHSGFDPARIENPFQILTMIGVFGINQGWAREHKITSFSALP